MESYWQSKKREIPTRKFACIATLDTAETSAFDEWFEIDTIEDNEYGDSFN